MLRSQDLIRVTTVAEGRRSLSISMIQSCIPKIYQMYWPGYVIHQVPAKSIPQGVMVSSVLQSQVESEQL